MPRFVIFLIMFVISAALLIATGWLVDEYGIAGETMFWNHEGLWFSMISSFVAASVMSVKLYNRHHRRQDFQAMAYRDHLHDHLQLRKYYGFCPIHTGTTGDLFFSGGDECDGRYRSCGSVLHDKVSRKTEAFS